MAAWADSAALTLDAAIAATLKSNPQLQVQGYQFRARALAGEQQTAALNPQLKLGAELENVAGSGAYRGVDAGELTLSLSSVIELGGQRDACLGLVTARPRSRLLYPGGAGAHRE